MLVSKTHREMFLCLPLVLVPADDGGILLLHHCLGRLVGPLSAEHEDLTGLLHVLLLQAALLLREDVGGQGLGDGHRGQAGHGHWGVGHPHTSSSSHCPG